MHKHFAFLRVKLLTALLLLSFIGYSQLNSDTINAKAISIIEGLDAPIKVGLVLSGGGAKGLAHIGVLKVLEEEGIFVEYIGGTSMGGLVGGLYASGYSPWELDSITKSMPWEKLMSDKPERSDLPIEEKKSMDQYLLSLPVKGFVPGLPKGLRAGQLVLNYINKLTWPVADINNFSELPIPFFCVATKLVSGDTMVLKNGDLALALRSTMSIPTVFEPVVYNNHVLIDGMMVNNFPIDIMKMNPDVDFIIGVDVGSPLLKVDEITNILSILEQTSSYHAYDRLLKNIELADLYLKPEVDDISALAFDSVGKIIDLGEDIARANIDAIRALAKKIKDNKKKFKNDRKVVKPNMIYISEVNVKGLNKVPRNMIIGRLGLNLPGVNNIKRINEAINRLYSSNYFKSIDYKLNKELNSYSLDIVVEEKIENLFEIGANYNSDLGANLKINFLFNNIIFKGSKTNISITMGNTPSGKYSFITERGKKVGLGVDVGYNARQFFVYSEDYKSIEGKYYTRFANFTAFGNTNFSNNAELQIGGNVEFFDFSSKISPIPIEDLEEFYTNIFATYSMDTYDNKYVPTKGIYYKSKFDIINIGRPETGIYANVKIGMVLPLTKRFYFLPKFYIGGLWSENNDKEYAYYYVVGGGSDREHSNSVYMPGLPYSAVVTNNVSIAYMDFRYKLWNNHFLYAKPSFALAAKNFEELLTDSELLFSGTVGYTYQSPVGPIGLQFGTSNLNRSIGIYFNIGMEL